LIIPAYAQDQYNSSDIISKMTTALDLQEDQVTNITPIIEKYSIAFADLQKSIKDGTINSSAIESQWHGLEDTETQELSQYFKPNQLSEWRDMQSQIYRQNGQDSGDNSNADQYSNLPNQ